MNLISFFPRLSSQKLIRKSLLTLSVIALAGFSSCHQNTNKGNPEQTNSATHITSNNIETSQSSLSNLKQFKGDYPKDVDLFGQKELKNRLKALLGDQYDSFQKYWQTETPIELDSEVLATSGCEEHNCAGNQWILQIDLAKDNINVYHFGNQGIQSFLEKGKINLPDSLEHEFQTMGSNM